MRIPIHVFFYIFLAFCISGCHDHEDAESQESSSSAVQVTVVFYPGQVGDHGYADGIMESLPQIGKLTGIETGTGKASHVDTQFFTFDSKQEALRALNHWTSHPENPFLGGNYQQRLLVLTDARQVGWLKGLQSNNLQDQLLLLNTSKEVVDSLAQSWGNRVHALNISVAHEAEALCRYIQQSMEQGHQGQNGDVDIFRMAGSYHTADSIDIVCQSMLSQGISVNTNYMEEWQEDPVTGEISYVQSQQYARFLAEFYYQYNKDHFLLLDGGSYNFVFDEMSPKDEESLAHTTFLDLNMGTDNPCIWRDYGRALIGWIETWMKSASPDAMPPITWHGSWDGYVESTVPLVP